MALPARSTTPKRSAPRRASGTRAPWRTSARRRWRSRGASMRRSTSSWWLPIEETRALEMPWLLAIVLNTRARLALSVEDAATVTDVMIEALDILARLRDSWAIRYPLAYLGTAAAMQSRPERAAVLYGVADAISDRSGNVSNFPVPQRVSDRYRAEVATQLGHALLSRAGGAWPSAAVRGGHCLCDGWLSEAQHRANPDHAHGQLAAAGGPARADARSQRARRRFRNSCPSSGQRERGAAGRRWDRRRQRWRDGQGGVQFVCQRAPFRSGRRVPAAAVDRRAGVPRSRRLPVATARRGGRGVSDLSGAADVRRTVGRPARHREFPRRARAYAGGRRLPDRRVATARCAASSASSSIPRTRSTCSRWPTPCASSTRRSSVRDWCSSWTRRTW